MEQQIKLTKRHKDKLLEMCNKLFPDTKWHFWESEEGDYPQMIGYSQHPIIGEHKLMHPALEIHWFELCMTHLAEKILNPEDKFNDNIKNKFTDFFINTSSYSWFIQDPGIRESFSAHPVDYLYEEFKKLNIK